MGSSTALLLECKKELEASTFDYNHILAASVLDAWRGVTAHVERQLELEKGIVIPVFGKFAFLKGTDTATPMFAFTDKFLKTYRVTSKRPLPALTWHCGDANYTTVAADAGMMKDQAQHTVEAIFKYVGEVAQAGTRSCRLTFGAVGSILVEGKCISFRYDPAFVLGLQGHGAGKTQSNASIKRTPSHIEALEAMAGIVPPRQVKSTPGPQGGMLTLNNYMTPPASSSDAKPLALGVMSILGENTPVASKKPSRHHHESSRKHKKKAAPSPQLMKCASDSVLGGVATSNQLAPTNVLPRFLIPESRTNRTQSTSELQQVILEKAYERHEATQARNRAHVDAMDAEYAQRTKAIEIRHLKDRAAVALQHRDMHDHLQQQALEKQQRTKQEQQQRTAPVTETATILPQARGRSKEQEKAHKAMLRTRLDAEIQKKRDRHDRAQQVQRDEEVFFMECVQKQHQKERQDQAQQKLADKEVLMREWSRQKKQA